MEKYFFLTNILKNLKKKLNQPELSYNIFYLNNELVKSDYFIYNKFIKKEVYIKALNSLNNYYQNILIVMETK